MVESPIVVEVSAGELLDKISILRIKQERIHDMQKLGNVEKELEKLLAARKSSLSVGRELEVLYARLKAVNEQLWEIEDGIREKEREQDFGEEFVRLARMVYRHNDQRCALKRAINELSGSDLYEEKSYSSYDQQAPI